MPATDDVCLVVAAGGNHEFRHEVHLKITFDDTAYPPQLSNRRVKYAYKVKTRTVYTSVVYECDVVTAKGTPLGYILSQSVAITKSQQISA